MGRPKEEEKELDRNHSQPERDRLMHPMAGMKQKILKRIALSFLIKVRVKSRCSDAVMGSSARLCE